MAFGLGVQKKGLETQQNNLTVSVHGEKDLLKMFKALGNDKNRIKELNSFLRKAARPIIKTQRNNIKNYSTGNEGFKVYRDGKILAETSKEQLAKTIGLLKFKGKNKNKTIGFAIGPRLDGVWKNPKRGGWFGWMFEYGTKYRKTGKGKINIRKKPFTNRANIVAAVNLAAMEVMNKESKVIEKTMKRFKKNYNFN
jgi:hypothetical protein